MLHFALKILNQDNSRTSFSFLFASFSLRDFGFGPRFADGSSASLSSNTWTEEIVIWKWSKERNLDESWIEDVLLRLPGAVLWTPPFPFHQVLKKKIFKKWNFLLSSNSHCLTWTLIQRSRCAGQKAKKNIWLSYLFSASLQSFLCQPLKFKYMHKICSCFFSILYHHHHYQQDQPRPQRPSRRGSSVPSSGSFPPEGALVS